MQPIRPLLAGLVLLGFAANAPAAEDADFAKSCQRLVEALGNALPPATAKELQTLLRDGAKGPAARARIQQLLDERCLCLVHINPESRVKAARGSLAAVLKRDRPALVLVKVHNEAGVTHPLEVGGPQLRTATRKDGERWLEAAVQTGPRLSGREVEYVVLRLIARESGKREGTLRFDVGQGTQDLGFRAEVPILFTVRP